MQMRKRAVLAVVALLPTSAVLWMVTPAVSAAPSQAGTAVAGTFDCADGEAGTFVVNSGNANATAWNVAHLTLESGGSAIFVPATLDLTFSYNGELVGTEQATKSSHTSATDTCMISATESVPGGSVTLSGTVTGKIIYNGG